MANLNKLANNNKKCWLIFKNILQLSHFRKPVVAWVFYLLVHVFLKLGCENLLWKNFGSGSAYKVTRSETLTYPKITWYYASSVYQGSQYSVASDLWSLGLSLLEMALGRSCSVLSLQKDVIFKLISVVGRNSLWGAILLSLRLLSLVFFSRWFSSPSHIVRLILEYLFMLFRVKSDC